MPVKFFLHQKVVLLGKKLGIDLVYIFKNASWLLSAQFITAVASFFLTVVLANFLPQEVFGNYKYVLSLGIIVSAFSLSGLNLAIIRGVARGENGLLKSGFDVQMKWSIGSLLASVAISGYYIFRENIQLAISIFAMGIFLPIISSSRVYTAFLEGRKNYKKLSLYNLLTTFIYTFFLLIVIYFTKYLPWIIGTYFAIQASCSYYFYIKTKKLDPTQADDMTKTLSFGKHLSFLNIFSTLIGQLDKILVFFFLGAPQLAVYAISQIPTANIRALLKQTAQVMYPKYAERDPIEIRKSIYKKMFLFSVPIFLIVLIYILLAPYLFNYIFPKYTEAVLLSQVSVLSLLFFQKKLITYIALAHGTKKIIYAMSFGSSILKVLLLLIFLPSFGMWGAVLSEIIAQFFGLISTLLIVRKI